MREKTVIVFDLDDTLYKEIDFLMSGYQAIVKMIGGNEATYKKMLDWYHNKENTFENLIDEYKLDLSIFKLVKIYRNHVPNISLSQDTRNTLSWIKDSKFITGLMTDGYSDTQRKKIEALGLESYFDKIIISEEFGSEKPDRKNYISFENDYPSRNYIYVGDNFNKDFITPNKLKWQTFGVLDDGRNIHKQILSLPKDNLPKVTISKISEIINYL